MANTPNSPHRHPHTPGPGGRPGDGGEGYRLDRPYARPHRPPSVLGGLLDLRFRQMVTPRLIGCLYTAVIGCTGAGCLAAVLTIWGIASWLGSGWLIFAPVVVAGGVVVVLAARVACEWVLMAFTRGRLLRADKPSEGASRQGGRPSP